MKPKTTRELLALIGTPKDAKLNPQENRGGVVAVWGLEDIFTGENDSNCEYKIGDKVEKATYEIGDVHRRGHKGEVVDNLYLEDEKISVYLIQFEGDDALCFTIEYKIKRAENG